MQAASGAPLSAPGAPDAPGAGGRRRRIGVLVGVAAFVLAADAITKAIVVVHLRYGQQVHLIGNVLMLNLLRNSGAAFSVGTGNTIVFTAIAVVVAVYIVRTARARNLRSLGWAIALGLLLGGALGNLADRIFRAPGVFRGAVVDWIQLTNYWPVFNLADSAIVCGGVLTVLLAILGYRLDGTRGDHPLATPAPAPPAEPAPGESDSSDAPTDAADVER
ncbi:signal peptidase II [Trebonia sp.]|uniref:signal peptidase II n=1 Tax=Trebonia sp. TaxID=2767075 RepID=UPI00260D192C|nr:signal peptidase II [Trebonia sp.]